MERYICIHGHFYQPPRENPWLETVEIQDSAYPYHDWNERITAESYSPNSASRLLDGEGCIVDIVSNYEKISFNFGPTLLAWMEKNSPETYAAILESDRRSVEKRGGHGNAIAQAYNHIIMPLAAPRDKRTQILWGIADFQYRFRRRPEGMWLPETGVDLETLDLLSEQGIGFTLLAPHQAAKIRKKGSGNWEDVSGARIDPTRAYSCALPSGREIVLFFYDGPISRAVAFENLLNRGEDLANRLLGGFSDSRNWDQLVNIATDGESYGHHHKFGDMALAYALHHIEKEGLARLTNYGEFLESNPPLFEVRIFENTSWSCAHGVDRWRRDCGCNSGSHPGWNQDWRAPLRKALDWLRDAVSLKFRDAAAAFIADPWSARDEYIKVILDRSEQSLSAFFNENALPGISEGDKVSVLQLLELQRNCMLMYTSCGWFFDELSGIETVQIICYAARVLQLAEKLLGLKLEKAFRERLSRAKSNIAERRDGAKIYEQIIRPTVIDLKKVAAHFAISSLMADYGESSRIYNFKVETRDYAKMQTGPAGLGTGKIGVASEVTLESGTFEFAVLHLGGHIFNAGVREFRDDSIYDSMKGEMLSTFQKGNIADLIRTMDRQFRAETYSLVNLFRDEQRRILTIAISKTLEDFEHEYRSLYEKHKALMTFLKQNAMPVPKVFTTAAGFALLSEAKNEFLREVLDEAGIRRIVSDAKIWDIPLDSAELEFMIRLKGEALIRKLSNSPDDFSLLTAFVDLLQLLRSLPIEINYWEMQNHYFKAAKTIYHDFIGNADGGSESALLWVDAFKRIGELLSFNIDEVLPKVDAVASDR